MAVALALLAVLAGAPGPAGAADPARITTNTQVLDLWPHVRLLGGPQAEGSLAQVIARDADFQAPTGPHANLGIRRDTVWLRVALALDRDAPDRWLFDVNYPALDRLDVHLLRDGRVIRRVQLGDALVVADRPMVARSHVVELPLEPGARYELLIRVRTTSSMIVPISLSTPAAFLAREARAEAFQGVLAGIGLCLLVYSLTLWIVLRDPAFGCYATIVAGVTLFFLAYNGLGAEHLWPNHPWLIANLSPLGILIALWGGFQFLERTLRVDEIDRRVAWLMHALGWVSLASAVAFIGGLLDYRQAQAISTMLGPTPMLICLPMAWIRMRRGDRLMVYLFAGWAVYSVGVGVMAALLRGLAPWNGWTQHAFQLGSMAEMLFWLIVLGKRVEEIRETGQRAQREREAMRSLAATDALTGLPNRRGLDLHLAARLFECGPSRCVAVYMADLDGFKPVNDRFGHEAGDRLLQAVAQRLREGVRRTDFVARLGGDEFVIVAHDVPDEAAAHSLGRQMMAAFDAPFAIRQGESVRVGVTIGFAMALARETDPDELLRRADTAMYAGKQAGRQCLLSATVLAVDAGRQPGATGFMGPACPPASAGMVVSRAQGHPADHLA